MKTMEASTDVARRLGLVPLPARDDVPAHIKWLIDNYTPPSAVINDVDGVPLSLERPEDRKTAPKLDDTVSPSVERAAVIYRLRERKETFIEWLWMNYPPVPPPDED